MALNSAYYDSCIFLESLNPAHPEQTACCDLLSPAMISWAVRLCAELTEAETTASEHIDKFEVDCAANGVAVIRVSILSATRESKKHLGLRKNLFQRGLTTRDWKHLMSAVASQSEVLCSTDNDFWDPHNKAQRKARKKKRDVQKQIEASLPVLIRLPSETLLMARN